MSSGLKTAILLGGMSGLLMLAGGLMGGSGGLIIAFVMAVGMNVFSYWFSDKLVLRMYQATEVGEGHPLYRWMTVGQAVRFTRGFYTQWHEHFLASILDHFGISPKVKIGRLSRRLSRWNGAMG